MVHSFLLFRMAIITDYCRIHTEYRFFVTRPVWLMYDAFIGGDTVDFQVIH